MISILQWNIHGYFNNYHELQLLIKDLKPSVLCLQETHIRHNFDPKPPYGYNGYFLNSPQYQYSKQGVAILVKEDIPHKIVFTNITLLTIAIEILFNPKLIIINTYNPPKQSLSCSDILSFHYVLGGSLGTSMVVIISR